jgi:hypothetical protein
MNSAPIVARVLLVAALLAAPSASTLAQPSPVVPAIATENAEIASRIVAEEAALGQERAELSRRKAIRSGRWTAPPVEPIN